MLLDVLSEMGIVAHMHMWDGQPFKQLDIDTEVEFTRIRLCLPADRDDEIREFLLNETPATVRPLATIWWDKA